MRRRSMSAALMCQMRGIAGHFFARILVTLLLGVLLRIGGIEPSRMRMNTLTGEHRSDHQANHHKQ